MDKEYVMAFLGAGEMYTHRKFPEIAAVLEEGDDGNVVTVSWETLRSIVEAVRYNSKQM